MSDESPHGLDSDYPLLWAAARNADDRERLGLAVSPEDAEAARAMLELWTVRSHVAAFVAQEPE